MTVNSRGALGYISIGLAVKDYPSQLSLFVFVCARWRSRFCVSGPGFLPSWHRAGLACAAFAPRSFCYCLSCLHCPVPACCLFGGCGAVALTPTSSHFSI